MLLNESYKLQLTMDLWSVPPTGVGVGVGGGEGGGGQQGQFTPGPQCKGHKNSAGLVQIRSGSSVTFHSSLFVSLYFMHNYMYLTWL